MEFKAIKAITNPKEGSDWVAVITMDGQSYPIHKNFLNSQSEKSVAIIETPKKTDLLFGMKNGEKVKATKDSQRKDENGDPIYLEGSTPTYEEAGIVPTPRVVGLCSIEQAVAQRTLSKLG